MIKQIIDDINKIVYKPPDPPLKPPDIPSNTPKKSLHLTFKPKTHTTDDENTDAADSIPDETQTSKSTNMSQSVRCSEKSFFDTSVVKCTLNQFISPDLADIIKLSVRNFSKISFDAHHIANIRFWHILSQDNPHFPPLNQQFFAEAIYQVAIISDRKSNKSYPAWNDARHLFDSILPPGFLKPSRDKLIVSYLAKQMETEAHNHLNLNFRSRFKKYLKLTHSISKEATYYIVSSIMNDAIEDLDRYQKQYNTPEILKILDKYKKLLTTNLKTKRKSKKTEEAENDDDNPSIDIMENLDRFIPFLQQIMIKFKEQNVKGFKLLPLKHGNIPGFTTIDSLGLAKIVSMYDKKSEKQDIAKNNPISLWNDYSNIRKYEPKNQSKKFNYLIETNGYDVSIHFIKPKKNKVLNYPEDADIKTKYEYYQKLKQERIEREKQKKKDLKNKKDHKNKKDLKKVINEDEFPKNVSYEITPIPDFFEFKNALGLDPGKRKLFVASDKLGNKIQCTGKEYRHYLNNSRTKARVEARKKLVPEIKEMSKYSFKVTSIEEYLENLGQVYKIIDKIRDEYEKRYYRSLRFRRIQRKAKVYKMLGDRLAGEEDKMTKGKEGDKKKITIIGYGAGGSNGKGIKGGAVPIKGFASYLMKRKNVKVVPLNENYTSQKCHVCHSKMSEYKQWVKEKNAEGQDVKELRKVYGLQRCKSNVCCNVVRDRDENASECLYDVLEAGATGRERPEYLRKEKPS
jgi:hypothetical protein